MENNVMTIDEFSEFVASSVAGYFMSEDLCDAWVEPVVMDKDNRTCHGVRVHGPGNRETFGYSMNYYLDQVYRKVRYRFLQDPVKVDSTLTGIAEEIEKIWEETRDLRESIESMSGSLENVSQMKQHLSGHLINAEWNRRMLSDCPHRRIEDLALIYYVDIETSPGSFASVRMTNRLAGLFDMSERELYQTVLHNMAEKGTVRFFRLFETMNVTTIADIPDVTGELANDEVYVLTNRYTRFGSAMIVLPEIREKIVREMGEGAVIIPSSVHELLLLPKMQDLSKEQLMEIIASVNQTEVKPADRLSGHVYEIRNGELRISC